MNAVEALDVFRIRDERRRVFKIEASVGFPLYK
jgi:hypothetical protein